MIRMFLIATCAWIAGWSCCGVALAADRAIPTTTRSQSATQRILDQSAEDGRFTFIVFYKTDTPAVQAMAKVAKEGVAKRKEKAVLAFVQISDPAEQALIQKFDVARAPMPLTLALAPNLAVTGIFSKELKDDQFDAAIVTPTMTRCMKSLQEGKLVFVCVQPAEKGYAPPVVQAMQLDPEFANRVVVVSLQASDPDELRFLQQIQVDPRQVRVPVAALLAPPGMLIGKYDGSATKAQVATALHKAGKCCDDPNCKHTHGTSPQAQVPARRK